MIYCVKLIPHPRYPKVYIEVEWPEVDNGPHRYALFSGTQQECIDMLEFFRMEFSAEHEHWEYWKKIGSGVDVTSTRSGVRRRHQRSHWQQPSSFINQVTRGGVVVGDSLFYRGGGPAVASAFDDVL